MNDSLGDRMKSQYEDRTRYMLPRRTYTILRFDGRAFHRLTKNMKRPYDHSFMACMDVAAQYACREIQGSCFAYVQSDEISVLMTDFAKPDTAAWFDGNIQKMASVGSSVVTGWFNEALIAADIITEPAAFDCRVFTIPDPVEVENYFIWRQKDAERNSIQMLAQSYASHKELHCKNISKQHDIIHAAGDNWNDHPARFKRGAVVTREEFHVEIPVFTKDREYLRNRIPIQWEEDNVNR